MAGGGGNKKRYQCCTDSSRTSYISQLFKVIQDAILLILLYRDNVVIPSNFFQYIHHVGCAINLLSNISSGLIPGGQSLRKRQTVFFLPVDPMDKNHKDPDTIDLKLSNTQTIPHFWSLFTFQLRFLGDRADRSAKHLVIRAMRFQMPLQSRKTDSFVPWWYSWPHQFSKGSALWPTVQKRQGKVGRIDPSLWKQDCLCCIVQESLSWDASC